MDTPVRIVVQPSGQVVEARRGDRLLDIAREAGIVFEAICGGAGECGKCRVVVDPPDAVEMIGEPGRSAPSPGERAQGYVLACRSRSRRGCGSSVRQIA